MIRRFREQVQPGRMSLFRLVTLMQWEGTAPIIEMEKGRRRPRPETLNALGEALQLNPANIAYLHGLAGYREATVLPPIEQIKKVLQAIEPDIACRRYPVIVLDYQFRHWMVNTATEALVGGSLDLLTELIGACWQKYARRNRELAHLAANLLILLALLADCRMICGENLATLRTEGRGRGVRGRWRHWRNNTAVRGELWRVLSYKRTLLGIRAWQVEPRGTTHTCPHCHQPARTFASPDPADRKQTLDWGPWLCCEHLECLWNGARDYAASLNIARLGLALFLTAHRRLPSQNSRLSSLKVKPALYSRAGATLLLPSQGITPRPTEGKHVCYAGWSCSLALRTSRPTGGVAVLSTAHLRKRVLQQSIMRA